MEKIISQIYCGDTTINLDDKNTVTLYDEISKSILQKYKCPTLKDAIKKIVLIAVGEYSGGCEKAIDLYNLLETNLS